MLIRTPDADSLASCVCQKCAASRQVFSSGKPLLTDADQLESYPSTLDSNHLAGRSVLAMCLFLWGLTGSGGKHCPKTIESLPNCLHCNLQEHTSVRGSKTDGSGKAVRGFAPAARTSRSRTATRRRLIGNLEQTFGVGWLRCTSATPSCRGNRITVRLPLPLRAPTYQVPPDGSRNHKTAHGICAETGTRAAHA